MDAYTYETITSIDAQDISITPSKFPRAPLQSLLSSAPAKATTDVLFVIID